eukprot:TRINITY_DN7136_c0_g1_i1.p1 TRINITY_DN7136_c0_g1~~TRINITY_DN7136_c0_g1_i1.p1  ORF type:complete len:167 (+),score=45.85 TRINITY_DN7136_c0_g1_i1:210-710(+)
MALIQKAEELKRKQAAPEIQQIEGMPTGTQQQQKLRVCDVCGAFLSIYDSDRRLADHFGGKLHIGYMQIRDKLKELKESRVKKEEDKREDLGRVRVSRKRSRSPSDSDRRSSKEHRHSRDGDWREKDRDHDRHRRSDSYDRDRRDREGNRDRDRDRRYRDGSRRRR